jgi:hypothetical protein
MYNENFEHYATHGFITLFPHIKGPEADKNPLTTNTKGDFLIKALEFAKYANSDKDHLLYKRIDL